MIPEITEFKSLIELVQNFPTEEKCIEHYEAIRWGGNVISPFDFNSKVYKCKGHRYKCRNTNKYFNVRTGTIFEDTKIPLQKWFMAIYLYANHKKGISSHQLGRDLNITQKSAWFVLHRLRYADGHDAFNNSMGGGNNPVEVDESFFGGKGKNMHKSKKEKTLKNNHGKTVVFGMLERKGMVMTKIIKAVDCPNVFDAIVTNIEPNTKIMSDTAGVYRSLPLIQYNNKPMNYTHETVDHDGKEYVRGEAHINSVEGFWSLCKRSIVGIYHYVSPKHLDQYLNEFCYRYNWKSRPN